MLKAISAILIFLIGFLGFNSYNNISENIDKDFTKKLDEQNKRIDSLKSQLSNYENLIDSLKIEEGVAVKNISDINRRFVSIDRKLSRNNEALKYTTKVYVVSNLKYPKRTISQSRDDPHTIKFENLRTIYGEKLPKFKSKPMLVLQGKSAEFTVIDLTKEYVKIEISTNISYGNKSNFFYFDMWIADPN